MHSLYKVVFQLSIVAASIAETAAAAESGSYGYDDFEKASTCAACHREMFSEWRETLMAGAYRHQ